MPAPFRQPRNGTPVNNPPNGFPSFFAKRQPRIITADAWELLSHLAEKRLKKADKQKADAYTDQAFEFFEAADNPRLASRPLLYYYAFLNLAKVLILHSGRRLAEASQHGISDPRANQRQRLRLEGQQVRVQKTNKSHNQVFPELIASLNGQSTSTNYYVLDLFKQVPAIHRTCCQILSIKPSFCPIQAIEVRKDGSHVWAQMCLSRDDADVQTTLPHLKKQRLFSQTYSQVFSGKPEPILLETAHEPGTKRGIDKALSRLATSMLAVRIWSVLTPWGLRFYFSTLPPKVTLPQLASLYALMFYLGSITRYKPYDFDKILGGKYAWLVAEFLKAAPTQFLYGLASHIAGVEVVRPYAVS